MPCLFFTPTISGIFFFGKPSMGRIIISKIILTIKFFIYSAANITIIFILSKSALFAFFAASFQIFYNKTLKEYFFSFRCTSVDCIFDHSADPTTEETPEEPQYPGTLLTSVKGLRLL